MSTRSDKKVVERFTSDHPERMLDWLNPRG
ncbi:hypothetical protein C8K30_101521 [Promicromonospora sp. AC04]|nr:hypothetical protein C8K30_101521 [Promicromonospora sp. AC04]